jgi:hypothetical protein
LGEAGICRLVPNYQEFLMSARPLAFSHPLLVPECTEARAPKALLPVLGGHRLANGSAMSLCPGRAASLRVLAGRAWVTLGGPYTGHGNDLGDVFLQAGDRLAVPAGARVVVEPVPDASGHALRFDWCESVAVGPGAHTSRLQTEVLAPARDLAVALGRSAQALWRLTWGLLGMSDLLVAGRGRVLSQWESNPP